MRLPAKPQQPRPNQHPNTSSGEVEKRFSLTADFKDGVHYTRQSNRGGGLLDIYEGF